MPLVTIDGTEIKAPTNLEVGKFNITKAQRSASGLMQMEIIATKRRVDLEWNMIRQANLTAILDLLDASVFHTLVYPDPQGNDGESTISVYVGDISEGLWHIQDGVRWWTGVRIGLIER